MFDRLSDRPRSERLVEFVERVTARFGDRISFVVLFGSMARGDFGAGSDYDVLIGLTQEDHLRWIDRLGDFFALDPGGIEPHPFSPREIEQLLLDYDPRLLDACNSGVVLRDDGRFGRIRCAFETLRAQGVIERIPLGWQIHTDRDREARWLERVHADGEEMTRRS